MTRYDLSSDFSDSDGTPRCRRKTTLSQIFSSSSSDSCVESFEPPLPSKSESCEEWCEEREVKCEEQHEVKCNDTLKSEGIPGPTGPTGPSCSCSGKQTERIRVVSENTQLSNHDNIVVISSKTPVTLTLPPICPSISQGGYSDTNKITIKVVGAGVFHRIRVGPDQTINEMNAPFVIDAARSVSFYCYGERNTWYSI
jgi:hypothetical protein